MFALFSGSSVFIPLFSFSKLSLCLQKYLNIVFQHQIFGIIKVSLDANKVQSILIFLIVTFTFILVTVSHTTKKLVIVC